MNPTQDRIAPLLAALGTSRDEVLVFVLMYSRMEYALKRAGFVEQGSKDRPVVKWGDFSRHIELASEAADSDFSSAADLLLKEAPEKQVLRNGRLDWAQIEDGDGVLTDKLVDRLNVVRNNLMHGGKYPHAPVGEPGRNRALLRAGVTVMDRILAKAECSDDPRVREVHAHFGDDLD